MSHIKKRNGEIVPFDVNRIQIALSKAYQATNTESTDIPIVVDDIHQQLIQKQQTLQEGIYIDVEYVQDIVEKTLMKYEKFETAKAYILYREQRKKEREEAILQKRQQVEKKTFMVSKDDGSKEIFDRKKIENTYNHIDQRYHEIIDQNSDKSHQHTKHKMGLYSRKTSKYRSLQTSSKNKRHNPRTDIYTRSISRISRRIYPKMIILQRPSKLL